tara:strand:- start:6820 stop:7329 length:510 start_codon:yes stop_codon:yes gene_type:complete
MTQIKITRSWCMPNKNTFDMKPALNLIYQHLGTRDYSIDPFARNSTIATHTNDLNENTIAHSHKDALEFLQSIPCGSVDVVLFDPPYSPRQLKECYDNIGQSLHDTKSSVWASWKNEISRVLVKGGKCISFGWNSNGIGKTRGFEMVEIKILSHGGMHNDTIITVEVKK